MCYFPEQDISPIELLGYAKNYIIEVQENRTDLPYDKENYLLTAYQLLTIVQEYFYNK